MYPIITEEIQKKYEQTANKNPEIPVTCGIYGRACRCFGKECNGVQCQSCTLAAFAMLQTGDPVYKVIRKNGRGSKNFIAYTIITSKEIYDTFNAYCYELKEIKKV